MGQWPIAQSRIVVWKSRSGRDLKDRSKRERDAGQYFDEKPDLPDRPLSGQRPVANLMPLPFGQYLLNPVGTPITLDHIQITVAEPWRREQG